VIKFFKSYYVTLRFFAILGILVVLYCFAFFFPALLTLVVALTVLTVVLLIIDSFLLYVNKSVRASRGLPEKLSNGDDNSIFIQIENQHQFPITARVIDEIPHQFQKRDFEMSSNIAGGASSTLNYELRPVKRGVYQFGAMNIFVSSPLKLVERRYQFDNKAEVPVYPSFLQMRKYELLAISNRLKEYGIKKIRRIGRSQEFEQIKDYVQGDDIRTINWKATARRRQLMVNQYTDERSQRVYCIIDKGRLMKSPFDGLTLLDYAINSSLVISNIVLKHHNKPGLITFDKKVDTFLPAENKNGQLIKILELLYAQTTNFDESGFDELYIAAKRKIGQRSLLILYTNFRTIDGLHRHMKYLRYLAKKHLLAVVVFRNTEIDELMNTDANSTHEVYIKTIGQKFEYENRQIVKELRNNGIHTIYTSPQELSVNTLNKYLELRARGLMN